ncbi:MAG: sulfite exporter TauE/SafE family protein [Anaerolineales bacterium]|jgi:sulfite exporter TauE/SafE|nr:sulfite exporter TauE/SafE family protein [Anaerolineales bacterium]
MDQIMVAFITGLTTGGLSCLAVQGGLLATSLAVQIEQDMLSQAQPVAGRGKQAVTSTRHALPILLFLLAKLVAYTLLGALLGLVGSWLTFSPVMRALLLFAIGVFMIGNGLRMLNVHPFFRIFIIEPPRFITRYIRRKAKNGTDLTTPLFLGALTVFIPCGVTQAMMAVALGTGSALAGAALLFAFTLGTSPVFFLVAYLAAQLGKRLERFFMRFVAVVVLILGLVTVDSGLNLIGSPLSFSNLTRSVFAPQTISAPAASSVSVDGVLELQVANNGYFPKTLNAPANTSLTLALVTENTTSCARDFVIPALDYYQLLPSSGITTTEIPPQEPGSILRFTCSMGMYTGQIVFDQ